MTFREAQADLRGAYLSGAAGVFASGLVWLVAGVVAVTMNPVAAIAALFLGGMAIHPLGIALLKLSGRYREPAPGNPLLRLAIEGTIWMLLAVPLGYVLSFQRPVWFFLVMLLAIGGRYLTFTTLYGLRVYWALGAALILAAMALYVTQAPVFSVAFTVAAIETAFAAWIYALTRKSNG
jgi:hypothetical protein